MFRYELVRSATVFEEAFGILTFSEFVDLWTLVMFPPSVLAVHSDRVACGLPKPN